MPGTSDFWSAFALASLMSEIYGGEYEIGYSDGKFIVQRAPLPESAMCRDYHRFRETLYQQCGVES